MSHHGSNFELSENGNAVLKLGSSTMIYRFDKYVIGIAYFKLLLPLLKQFGT